MNKKHRETLRKILSHPTSHNVEWKRIERMLAALGANLSESSSGRIKVALNGNERDFHRPHHKNLDDPNEIVALRTFLADAGVTIDHPFIGDAEDAG